MVKSANQICIYLKPEVRRWLDMKVEEGYKKSSLISKALERMIKAEEVKQSDSDGSNTTTN